MIFKAILVASQRQPFCPYKALNFQTLRHPQFLNNFQSPKFKFSASAKKNVGLFGVMTKTSVPSDQSIPYRKIFLFFITIPFTCSAFEYIIGQNKKDRIFVGDAP